MADEWHTPTPSEHWVPILKAGGVKLFVEIDLSFEQFRKMLSDSIGVEQSDQEVYLHWCIAQRRILPPDAGSFSGMGYDINEIVRAGIATRCD